MSLFGWRLVRVCGDSMSPLLPADSYAVFRTPKRIVVGDIILADHDRYGRIIKRVRALQPDGVALEGISPQSTSPEALGVVPSRNILGKLALKLRR